MKVERRAVQRDLLKRAWIRSPDDLVEMYLGRADLQPVRALGGRDEQNTSRRLRLPGSALASLVLTRQSLLLFHMGSRSWEWMADFLDVAVPELKGATLDLVFINVPPPRWRFTMTVASEAVQALAVINSLRQKQLSTLPVEERINQETSQADALWRLDLHDRVIRGYGHIADSGVEPHAGAANLRIGLELRRRQDIDGAEAHLLRAEQTGRDDIAALAACLLGNIALQRRDTAAARHWATRAGQVPSAASQSLRATIAEAERLLKLESLEHKAGPT